MKTPLFLDISQKGEYNQNNSSIKEGDFLCRIIVMYTRRIPCGPINM